MTAAASPGGGDGGGGILGDEHQGGHVHHASVVTVQASEGCHGLRRRRPVLRGRRPRAMGNAEGVDLHPYVGQVAEASPGTVVVVSRFRVLVCTAAFQSSAAKARGAVLGLQFWAARSTVTVAAVVTVTLETLAYCVVSLKYHVEVRRVGERT